ncbi:Signal transduction histidine kinase [Ignavibacterium album JCM 16511]|uniref:histidine kinase n=1 Tax=Ignavibacterium album (strain DSM 19864 / JCM 16511 / NBRC 101810 / Mat9-16) TaxID=945713 RepID=I0AG42_IGNAJ|nr:PAS domain S-box protein [Ignavibacterium album]AFH47949.1 Signal transduction histidine kinase [Ignavibacterium album JCM 16511]
MEILNLKSKVDYLIFTAALTIVIIVIGLLIFVSQRQARIEDGAKEITSVAKAKIDYLSNWYSDEYNDALLISSGKILKQKIKDWFSDPNISNQSELLEVLNQIKLEHDYDNINIVNDRGEILFPADSNSCKERIISYLINNSSKDIKVLFTDIFYCEEENRGHILFLVPIKEISHFIAFELNPDIAVYSHLKDWPNKSNTSEIYLARQAKDSIIVISELRFKEGSAHKHRYSINDKEAAVVKAAKGLSGITYAKDYRGENVIAYVDKIPGTNWLLVAKTDVDEILSALKFEALLLAVFIILLISMLWLGLAFFFNYRQKNLFRNLWRSQAEFQTTLYSIGDAVITTDKESKVKYLNPVAEKLTGWKESQARGKKLNKVFYIINEYTREEVENPVEKVLEKGMIVGLANHTILISKDGREIPIADSGAPIKDEDGNIIGVVLVFRDQTQEREKEKLLKESEESYRGLFNSVQEAIYIQDEKGVFLDVNEGAVKMYGYEKEYFIGKTPEFVSAPGLNDLPKVAECVKKAFNGEPQQFEFWGIRKNGEVFPKDVRLYPGKYFSKKVVIALAQDITERKKAEKELLEKEREYSALISNLPGFVYRCANDKAWTMYFISNGCESITGYTSEEFLFNKKIAFNDIIHPEYQNKLHLIWEDVLQNRSTFEYEYPIFTKSGEQKWVWERGYGVFSETGELLFLEGFITDVTERKIASEKLKQSEQNYRQVIEHLPDAVVIHREGKFLFANPATLKLIGAKSFDEVKDMPIMNFVHPDYHKVVNERIKQAVTTKSPLPLLEEKLINLDGQIIDAEITAIPIMFEGKLAIQSIIRDITDKKKAELKVQETQQRIEELVNTIDGIVWEADAQTFQFRFVSKRAEKILGYPTDDWLNENFWQDHLHPDDKGWAINFCISATMAGEPHQFEYRMIAADGRVVWLRDNVTVVKKDNKPYLLRGILVDITEQKTFSDKIEASERKLRSIFQALPDIFLILDYEGRYLEIAPSNESLLYRPAKELLGKTLHEVFPKETADRFLNLVRTTLTSKQSANMDYDLEINGKKIWFSATTVPFEKDKVIYIARDITERKLYEQVLRANEQRFQAISSLTTDYLFATEVDENNNTKTTWVAGAFEKMTGYTVEEYIAIGGWHSTLHKDDLEKDKQAFEKLLRNEDTEVEVRTFHKDGHIVWVRSYGHPIWNNEKNRLAGIIGAVKDITLEKRNSLVREIQYNIAEALVSFKSLKELFEIVRKELSAVINVRNFYIALYDEATGMFRADIEEDELEEIPEWPAEGSMSGYILKTGKSLMLTKPEIEEMISKGEAGMIGIIPQQWIGVPLKIRNKVIGVLVVQSYRNPKRYDKATCELLEIVANQLSVFIERKRIEENTLKLSKAIEQSPSSIVITDINGTIEYVNPKFSEITGYQFEEAIGQTLRILKSGTHDNGFYENLWQTILSGKDWRGEFHNRKKSGELYWEEAVISPLLNENGEITHFIAVKEDITEKKIMLEQIVESESRFRSIWENSLDGMRLLDENGIIVDVNPAYCRLVGMEPNQLRGRPLNTVYQIKDTSDESVKRFRERFRSRTVDKKFEVETNLWNGKKIWLELSNSFIEFPGNKILLLSIFRDVTDKKQMIDELIDAKVRAEEMNRVKSYFFANMSHELRTPLVGILGFSEVLKGELKDQPDLARMIDLINTSGQRLLETLNMILNISKLEAGKLEVRLADANIIPLLETSFNLFSSVAKKKNLDYKLIKPKDEVVCRIDPSLFQNIFNNLINNAVKFTKQGGVTVKVNLNQDNVSIEVSDTGIGIPESHQAIIWEEFRQASEGITRSFEGTGLGLTIVKKYTELLGGKIHLKSKVGEGSTFTVEFPVIKEKLDPDLEKAAERIQRQIEEQLASLNYQILYVEDDAAAIDVVSLMLRGLYSLDFARNADEALTKVKEKKYDAILMDINLRRGMDGLQLTQLIREMPEYKQTPIIALTAYAMEKEKQEFLSKGLSHYLSKPFRKNDLLMLLQNIFTKK